MKTDELWYKDAIFYELHVRAFYDSNADGIGDFVGARKKLDYRQVCAYVRHYEGERVLVVNNLSRCPQPVELDLERFRGATPIELLGNTPFQPIGERPYCLSLGPYGFYWFRLAAEHSGCSFAYG